MQVHNILPVDTDTTMGFEEIGFQNGPQGGIYLALRGTKGCMSVVNGLFAQHLHICFLVLGLRYECCARRLFATT